MELLNEILNIPAASGLENGLAQYLRTVLPNGYTDENGSFIYHKNGTGRSIVFAAAMDEPSVFVTHTSDDGFLRFCTNGIDARKLIGQSVCFADGTRGVIYSEKDKESAADMFIDAGVKVCESQAGKIESRISETGDRLFSFDIGRATIIYSMVCAAKKVQGRDAYFVFLSKTIGNRQSTSFLKDIPDDAEIVFIDKSNAVGYPNDGENLVALGGGTAVRAMDKSVISSKKLYNKACEFPHIQREVSERKHAGGSLQRANKGYETLVIGLPVRYCGEVSEMVSKSDIDELEKFIICYSSRGEK